MHPSYTPHVLKNCSFTAHAPAVSEVAVHFTAKLRAPFAFSSHGAAQRAYRVSLRGGRGEL